ncbi:hypothetical protein OHA98_14580 [Streptomyces sp. NBC_00654]|uniref:hypothetical protein n=1 Tax=Streptomyces sp. NBC_00654 TaxID=2975799 RepID=UPI0022520165|nr:hypothetical protein [Streptomyces sp. NBC_00654]MCX4966048.1 hypothetical protein [Streptomyces sp. NBC_00654]
MSVFESEKAAAEALGRLITELWEQEGVRAGLRDSGLTVLFRHTKPNCPVFLSADGVVTGDEALRPASHTLKLTSSTAHALWLGEIPVASALTGGRVTIFGKMAAVPDLMNIFGPAFELYPKIAADLKIAG